MIFLCGTGAVLVALPEVISRQTAAEDTATLETGASAADPVQPGTFNTVTRRSLSLNIPQTHPYSYEPGATARRAASEATFRHNGKVRRVYIAARPGRDPAPAPAPAVFLLHGSGRNGLSMIDMWREIAQQKGAVLIAPDSVEKNWTAADVDNGFTEKALQAAEQIRPVDRARVFLFGHSADAVHTAALLNSPQTLWLASATYGGYPRKPIAQPKADAPPLRFYLGTANQNFPIDGAKAAGQVFSAAGHDVGLYLIPGHTHWYYNIGPRVAADAWAWFRSQPALAEDTYNASN